MKKIQTCPDCEAEGVNPKHTDGTIYCNKHRLRRYRATAAGRAAQRRYDASEKAKVKRKLYQQSEKGKATQKRYKQSEKGKAATRRAKLKEGNTFTRVMAPQQENKE